MFFVINEFFKAVYIMYLYTLVLIMKLVSFNKVL